MAELTTSTHIQIRTFELVQYITAPLEGTFEDWPAQIQDAIHEAMERKSDEVELPLTIVSARCDKDHDSTDPLKVWFVHVILSEVVAKMIEGPDKGKVHQ